MKNYHPLDKPNGCRYQNTGPSETKPAQTSPGPTSTIPFGPNSVCLCLVYLGNNTADETPSQTLPENGSDLLLLFDISYSYSCFTSSVWGFRTSGWLVCGAIFPPEPPSANQSKAINNNWIFINQDLQLIRSFKP